MKPLNVFAAKNEGWCLTETPNEDAVCKSHEALGFKVDKGSVAEVSVLWQDIVLHLSRGSRRVQARLRCYVAGTTWRSEMVAPTFVIG